MVLKSAPGTVSASRDAASGFVHRVVGDWPGLDGKSGDGFTVDHGALRTIAEQLVVDLDDVDIPFWFRGPNFDAGGWGGASQVSKTFLVFSDSLFCVTSDAMVECVVAACGIATGGTSYDIADDHSWLTRQSMWDRYHGSTDTVSRFWPTPRSNWSSLEKGYAVSSRYPTGDIWVERSDRVPLCYGYDDLSKEQIRDLLMTGDEHSIRQFSKVMKTIAEDLGTLKGRLRSHAADVSHAWTGVAAEKAQRALQKIYEAMSPLIECYNSISSLAWACAEDVLVPAKQRFDRAVTKGNWFTDIFQDDDDESARKYLRDVDERFSREVIARFPQEVHLDLPGLIRPADQRVYYVP